MRDGRGRQSLPRSARIVSSRDYRAISKTGRRVAGRSFVVLERSGAERRDVAESRPGRLGITASRRVGNAVARNRVKRMVREWFRRLPERPVTDWVVIARRGAPQRSGREVAQELGALVEQFTRRGAQ